ncbi:hypothetical protein PQR62_15935 [Herbaspirillum lusitanum]|uniref:Uncharacterized protein n=1 Tax=Herbaspirillum lusitanum TaxID=213312 RepID=A0ABW9ABA9_9BURK
MMPATEGEALLACVDAMRKAGPAARLEKLPESLDRTMLTLLSLLISKWKPAAGSRSKEKD